VNIGHLKGCTFYGSQCMSVDSALQRPRLLEILRRRP